jgi:hypothetical protein
MSKGLRRTGERLDEETGGPPEHPGEPVFKIE